MTESQQRAWAELLGTLEEKERDALRGKHIHPDVVLHLLGRVAELARECLSGEELLRGQ